MSRFRIGAIITVGILVNLGFSSVSRGEDALLLDGINCGGNCGNVLLETHTNSLLNAIPGATFVITLLHVAPSPEDAIVRKNPVTCKPIRYRVDMLKVAAGGGPIGVELGEAESLNPGEAGQIVYKVDLDQVAAPHRGNRVPTYKLDMVGFRFRSEPASPRCSIVASGQLYTDSDTIAPIPFALIPSVGPSPNGR